MRQWSASLCPPAPVSIVLKPDSNPLPGWGQVTFSLWLTYAPLCVCVCVFYGKVISSGWTYHPSRRATLAASQTSLASVPRAPHTVRTTLTCALRFQDDSSQQFQQMQNIDKRPSALFFWVFQLLVCCCSLTPYRWSWFARSPPRLPERRSAGPKRRTRRGEQADDCKCGESLSDIYNSSNSCDELNGRTLVAIAGFGEHRSIAWRNCMFS